MLTAALLGLALLADVPVAAVAVGAVAATQPTLLLGAAATWALHQARRRRRIRTRPDDEAAFLRALSSEVRSGASLRVALADAALRVPEIPVGAAVRLGRAGAPMTEVAPRLEAALPVNGRLTAAAFRIASDSGARTADLFEDLALQAAETAALERERQTTTAQARLSAGVVAVAPVLFGGLVFLARGPAIAGGGPWAVAVAVAGLLLAPVPTLLVAGVAALVWSRAMAARRRHAERRAAADLLALARLTALGLTAGMPFLGAVGFAAGEVGPTVRAEVTATLRRVAREGSPAFATARGQTRRLFLLAGRAAASGAPVLPVVQGYAAELHAEDRARRIAAVRRLPVRLLFPLALLILPGFVLLAVGPAVIAGLRRLGL